MIWKAELRHQARIPFYKEHNEFTIDVSLRSSQVLMLKIFTGYPSEKGSNLIFSLQLSNARKDVSLYTRGFDSIVSQTGQYKDSKIKHNELIIDLYI